MGTLKGSSRYAHYQSFRGQLNIEAEDETSEEKVLIQEGGVDTPSC
jgi:hypothetical protein